MTTIKRALPLLLIIVSLLSSCTFNRENDILASDNYDAPKPLGYDFILFDSNGDGKKDDIAMLTCMAMSGGYGAFHLEVFAAKEGSYTKMFDSEEYVMEEQTYETLAAKVDGVLMIDTFYSVEAMDVDGDGCDELVCRQYAWAGSHANHVGDVVMAVKVNKDGFGIISVQFEAQQSKGIANKVQASPSC